MLSFDQLLENLRNLAPKTEEQPLGFVLCNPSTGEIRMGALWQTVGREGWYVEVGNLDDHDYLMESDRVPGLYVHYCDADLDEDHPLDTAEARLQQNLECAARGVFSRP